jgi:anti-sigma regulatory factor (Ser/Thr protein kinase)
MTDSRTFRRSFESLDAIAAFTGAFFAGAGIDPGLRPAIDLALEELFTNIVKYGGASRADVEIAMACIPGGVEVTLIDHDAAAFDVTRAPDADLSRPIEERLPERRLGRTTFRKTTGELRGSGVTPRPPRDRARD